MKKFKKTEKNLRKKNWKIFWKKNWKKQRKKFRRAKKGIQVKKNLFFLTKKNYFEKKIKMVIFDFKTIHAKKFPLPKLFDFFGKFGRKQFFFQKKIKCLFLIPKRFTPKKIPSQFFFDLHSHFFNKFTKNDEPNPYWPDLGKPRFLSFN